MLKLFFDGLYQYYMAVYFKESLIFDTDAIHVS